MKLLNIIAAGVLATSASIAAATPITLHFTGSTAFRAATHTAISNYLTSLGGSTVEADYVGSSLNGASQAIFSTTVSGVQYVAVTKWSGSDQGILDTAGSNTLAWLDTSNLTGTSHQITSPSTTDSHVPEVALADNSQIESTHIGGSFITLVKAPTETDATVGIVPFVWVKGSTNNTTVAASLAGVTNISHWQALSLLGGGGITDPANGVVAPLSILTGNSADENYPAIVLGRDSGSGTRLNTFLEAGFALTDAPMQYTVSPTGGPITNTITLNALGTAGYAGGGALVTAINTPLDSTKNSAPFAYLGIADAANRAGVSFNSTTGEFTDSTSGSADCNVLRYNGVRFSYAAVREGAYTLWNAEYLLVLPSGLSTDQNAIATGVANQIISTTASLSGLKLSSMQAYHQNGAGSLVVPFAVPTVN